MTSFEAAYREHFAFAWRALRRLGVPERDLADAVQDVFVVLYRKFDELDRERPFKSWLYAVCLRVASGRRRSAVQRHEQLALEAEPTERSETVPVHDPEREQLCERRELLEAALDAMSIEQRAVFTLFELEGCTGEEVAMILQIPAPTVHSRLRLGREISDVPWSAPAPAITSSSVALEASDENELEHWLDDTSDADDFERSVLRSGLAVDPPPGEADAVWSSMLGALALAPVPATVGATSVKTAVTGASKTAAVWLGVGKGFVVGLAIYGAGSGVTEVVARLAEPTSPAAAPLAPTRPLPARAPTPTAATARPEPALAFPAPPSLASSISAGRGPNTMPSAPPRAGELPSVAAFPEPPNEARRSQLQAEAAALRSARSELRAGRLADAFATLEASRRQFSTPALDQEREALLIELLFRTGQVAMAQQRAAAFLEHFSDSPHAAAIRQLRAH